jgi:hypothetical protein
VVGARGADDAGADDDHVGHDLPRTASTYHASSLSLRTPRRGRQQPVPSGSNHPRRPRRERCESRHSPVDQVSWGAYARLAGSDVAPIVSPVRQARRGRVAGQASDGGAVRQGAVAS